MKNTITEISDKKEDLRLYRLYNENNVFTAEVNAKSYADAKYHLKPNDSDKIFIVEQDNHEVICGKSWISNLLLDMKGTDQLIIDKTELPFHM